MSEITSTTKKVPRVSFSQFSKFLNCNQQWKLDYLDGLRVYEGNLNTCFGTAIHNTIQLYIKTLYTDGVIAADSLNAIEIFNKSFLEEINKEKKAIVYTDDELKEFQYDGEDILKAVLSTANRIKHFPVEKYEFIGTEFPLTINLRGSLDFIAFVDLILKNKETGRYKIFDFKTSTSGWNSYMKEDDAKVSQVLLYKVFYAKKFNIPLSLIDVEFFILKRKLYEKVAYPQSKIQIFTPNDSKSEVMRALDMFAEFVNAGFTSEGDYNIGGTFPKNPGKAKKNCKYCSHLGTRCDGKYDELSEK